MAARNYYVYVIRSRSTGYRYVGQTTDLERRLKEHNSGEGGRYTRGHGPWELVYREAHSTRSEAMRRERFLRSGKGRGYLKKFLDRQPS